MMVQALLILALASTATPVELRASIHVHTTFSDGEHSLDEVAELARSAGSDVVVLADHFMDEISYGLPGLREGASMTLGVHSLSPRRLRSFLDAAEAAQKRTGVLMLPGVELTPYYHWEGSPFLGKFTLRSADRHLLVIFPESPDPDELADALPTVASPAGRHYGWDSILLLWPLLPLVWGLRRLIAPPFRTIRTRFFVVRKRARSRFAWLVLILSMVVLVRSWPFTVPRFSPYSQDVGLAPYQYAVDEAEKAGALTFWPHPEASTEYRHSRYPVTYRSDAYPDFVARTPGVTGFASLFEGYRQAAAPGGPWDVALLDYCRGNRSTPVWTIGEISMHETGEAGGKHLGQVETVLRVRERSRAAVLEALASGHGYAVRHAPEGRLILEDFTVTSGDREARAGDHLSSVGERRVEVHLRREGTSQKPVTVSVLRDGSVVHSESLEVTDVTTSIVWRDSDPVPNVSFYRVVVEGQYPEMILSNPVFVSGREETF